MAKSVIFKAFQEAPAHVDLDLHTRGVIITRHQVSGKVVKSWGWTLKEVLRALDWNYNQVWAVFLKPYKLHLGAIDLSPILKPDLDLSELNPKGGKL